MGRKKMLDAGQVEAIRASTKTLAELATEYEVSTLTLGKVRRFQGAYKQGVKPLDAASEANAAYESALGDLTAEQFIPFDPPVRHE